MPSGAQEHAHRHGAGGRLDWAARLRDRQLRVTAPRLAVLAVLEHEPHLAAEEIASRARERLGSLSTQAVYDVLRALRTAELVRSIEPAGSATRYEVRVGDNHHHLVCRACGVVVDVRCAVGDAPCLEPAEAWGFAVDEAEITFWGLCPSCTAGSRNEKPTTPATTA